MYNDKRKKKKSMREIVLFLENFTLKMTFFKMNRIPMCFKMVKTREIKVHVNPKFTDFMNLNIRY